MKKILEKSVLALSCLFVLGPPAALGASKDGPLKIGIAIPTNQEEIWIRHLANLEAACAESGFESVSQVANSDADRQFTQIENMLTQGIDALVVAAADSGALTGAIEAAIGEGVKVIGYDRVLHNTPYHYFITFDNVKVGQGMSEYAVSRAPRGKYVLLGGDITTQPGTDQVHEGVMKGLEDKLASGDITVVMDQNCKLWAPAEGLAHMENALTANNNDIDAVICSNDGIASGAIEALENVGLAGKVVVTGQDAELTAAQRVVAGTQSMTTYKPSDAMARITIDIAAKLVRGEEVEVHDYTDGVATYLIPPVAVDKGNIDEVLIESGFMAREQVYIK
jgi:D-xylose transport system substrate-binding protein